MKGSVYKRCGCMQEYDARGNRKACKLRHGSWVFVADAGRKPDGKRRQIKRGGFRTQAGAQAELAALSDSVVKGTHAHDERQTVAAFLVKWLHEKAANGLRPTTARSYRQHIDGYLVPHLGRHRLGELRPSHVEEMLRGIAAARSDGQKIRPATVRRVHATLRSALGTAKRRRLVAFNAALDVELPASQRPKVRPWEPAELGAFLDHCASDRLGVLFEVIAATGMRRGEALGLRWEDVDTERGRLVVRQQVIQLNQRERAACTVCRQEHTGLAFGQPKTSSGDARMIDLDAGTVGTLIAHNLAQAVERVDWGEAYSDHGLVFAREDGTPISPERVTKRFAELVKECGLRRVRLHDLRHGQASLMLAAGVPLAVVSKRLGHSSIAMTSDTYSHLLEGVGRDASERAMALVPRGRRDQSVTISA